MLGRDHHIGGAVERVRASGEGSQLSVMPRQVKGDLGTFGATNPVFLQAFGRIWPVEILETGDEAFCVFSDTEHPLTYWASLDWKATTLGAGTFGGIEHFFVGEYGAEVGTKPDGFFIHISEALFEKLDKDPLRPLKVARIGGVDFAVPVISESKLG